MSRVPAVLSRLVVVFLGMKMLTLLMNLWWFPVLRRGAEGADAGLPDPAGDRPTLLLPMRNEADRLPGTLPRLFASGAGRLIFLDDQSTDGSADLVRRAAAALPQSAGTPVVTVLDGSPRPEGWVGKNWACAQLADAAAGTDPLMFCDVDVELEPGALGAVLAEMRRQEADVFSIFPNQRRISWGERLLTPLIEDVLLCFLPFGLLRARARSARSAATACGALMVMRRAAYDRLGGYAAVRAELVEDVAMARLSRRRGLQLGLALGGDEVRVRMYDGYGAVITGLGRGITAAAGGRRAAVLVGYAWHLLAYTVPVLLLRRSPWWRGAALLAVAERALVEAKTGGRDWAAAAAVSASPVAAAPVVARAMRREQQWRGRVYR